MIRIVDGRVFGDTPPSFAYLPRRGFLAGLVLPLTRRARARHALQHMHAADTHLDFGCGDGHFLRQSPCRACWGYDPVMGDEMHDLDALPAASFDYITILSVLEYFLDPLQVILQCSRLLKQPGALILTTPKRITRLVRRMYVQEPGEDHFRYYTHATLAALVAGVLVVVHYETFNCGTNQLFILKKAGGGAVAPAEGSAPDAHDT